jgi:recombination protein RecR
MMNKFPDSINQLIEHLSKLPGIGRKTAQRLALYIINMNENDIRQMADALINAKMNTHYCKQCYNLTDQEFCSVCGNTKRDVTIICVVDTPKDLMAIERTKEYHGLYHVLHGSISPLDGIGPDDIKIKELVTRLADDRIQEVILANSPTIEGEATAVYLSKLLSTFDIIISRIAHGVPIGGDLEFADEVTLIKAMESRHRL